jgi:UrcA family protein
MGELRATLRAWFGSESGPNDDAQMGVITEETAMKAIALIAAGLLAGSGLAHAEDTTTTVVGSPFVANVPYQPSDLATESGVRELRFRVRQAAYRVCQPSWDAFRPISVEQNCFGPTVRGALVQVDQAVTRWRSGAQASAGSITIRAR